ncbi:MAG: sugar ABC transporter substrate-binding protein [Chloroflexi bacterium]|nr:sugar ABC transporter substrate-binding protein [Chloroflexota bacterium]
MIQLSRDQRCSRRSLLSLTVSATLGAVTLAACGRAPSQTVTTSTSAPSGTALATAQRSVGTAAPTAVAPNGQQVHLIATNWSNVAVAALYNKLVKQFEQAHPAIKVSYSPTTGNYWTKLLTQAAGSDAPDVFWMNAQNLGAWAARKQLLNLSSLAAKDKYDFSDFWKAGLAAYTLNGDLLSMPSQVDNRGLFFNKTLFTRAGTPPPPVTYHDTQWNWQAFLTACQHLTKSSAGGQPGQYGCLVPNGFINYAPWVWANGGHFMNPERTACTMTSPETVAAFQFLQDLIHKYRAAPGPDVLTTESAATLFSTGKIGMTTDTISMITYYRKNAAHFTWDTGALPAGKAGFANQSSGPAWSVEQQSKHADEAWLLSSFLVSPAAELMLAQGGALLPSRISIAKQVWEHPAGTPAHGSIFLDGMSYVHPNPFVWNWSQIETMLIKQLSYLWDGSKTAFDVMQAIKPQMDQLLRQKPS